MREELALEHQRHEIGAPTCLGQSPGLLKVCRMILKTRHAVWPRLEKE